MRQGPRDGFEDRGGTNPETQTPVRQESALVWVTLGSLYSPRDYIVFIVFIDLAPKEQGISTKMRSLKPAW